MDTEVRNALDDEKLELFLLKRYRAKYSFGPAPVPLERFDKFLRHRQEQTIVDFINGASDCGMLFFTHKTAAASVAVPIEQYLRVLAKMIDDAETNMCV